MNLDLTLEEVNVILTALGKAPYEAVFEIINKIKTQAVPQLKPKSTDSSAPTVN